MFPVTFLESGPQCERLGSENPFITKTFGLVCAREQEQIVNQTSDETLGTLEIANLLLLPMEIAQGDLVHQLRQQRCKGFAEEVTGKVATEVLQGRLSISSSSIRSTAI